MSWLSDRAIERLREITELPDLSETRYEMLGELGRGGMGVVYEVRDTRLNRSVALKVVALERLDGLPSSIDGEAQVIARLEHPGIVPVYDCGVLPDGRLYYTMKLVRGTRLDQWRAQPHGLVERLRLFTRICEPVAFAHASGVVHRDLKPANVMVGEFGVVLVMDWGAVPAATGEGRFIVGTPGYMAPEQENGEIAGPRTDVFALGAILAFLVEGQKAPRRLGSIVRRATGANPTERYADARELGDDVQRLLDGEPVAAHPENAFERCGRWLGRNRVLVALVAAYLVMRVIVFLWMRL